MTRKVTTDGSKVGGLHEYNEMVMVLGVACIPIFQDPRKLCFGGSIGVRKGMGDGVVGEAHDPARFVHEKLSMGGWFCQDDVAVFCGRFRIEHPRNFNGKMMTVEECERWESVGRCV